MPKMSDPSITPLVRALLLGDSGGGKTGALASLVKAGYNLYIADYDNGMEILRNILKTQAKADGKPENAYLSKVDYETCRDESKLVGTLPQPIESKAWAKGIKYMEQAFKTAGPNEIVCVDSLSFAAKAAMTYVLKINNRLGARPYESDWGDAQRHVERLIDMITSDAVKCHVLCTAHIAYSGGKEKIKLPDGKTDVIDAGPEKGFPAMIGRALNPVVGRYFNHTLLVRQVGTGNLVSRKIHTQTFEKIELKNTNPGVIKPDYPLATGLADYFADARGSVPSQQKVA